MASEAHTRLLRKLDSIATLTPAERDALSSLPFRERSVPARTTFVMEEDRPTECCLVLEGLVCAFNQLPEGARQITTFFVPGDIPDLQSLHLKRLDHSVATIPRSRLAFAPHAALMALVLKHPGLAMVLWRETLITGCIHRQWVTNLGRRDGYTRVAHVFCELMVRLRAVGLADEDGFRWDATQAELGDAVGLSPVHVNRLLQQLRSEGIISTEGRRIHVPDWKRLQEAGEFDATYLHLTPQMEASLL